jgi:hypothetical protein
LITDPILVGNRWVFPDGSSVFAISGGAGNYVDVPEHRMAYHRDGTAVVDITAGSVITELTGVEKANMNDESDATAFVTSNSKLAMIFPQLRDIAAYFAAGDNGFSLDALKKSADTTNGVDGTWVTIIANWARSGVTSPNYRTAIQSISATGVKALRWEFSGGAYPLNFKALHVYGNYTAGQASFLKLWRPSSAAFGEPIGDFEAGGAFFDFGDVPRSSSTDRKFRVKNTAAALTANNVNVSIGALTDTAPSVPGQYLFSTDGVNFFANINIGNLAPGALSANLWVRRTTPANAVFGLWTALIVAAAGSWT